MRSGVKSRASMLPEMSSASTMSMPRVVDDVSLVEVCGRASAMIINAVAAHTSTNGTWRNQYLAVRRRAAAKASTVDMRTAAPPRSVHLTYHATIGTTSANSHNNRGFAKLIIRYSLFTLFLYSFRVIPNIREDVGIFLILPYTLCGIW